MQKRDIVVIIILGLLVVIFATQNAEIVLVQLWVVKFKIALSLLIISALLVGAVISWLFTFKELKNRKKSIEEKDSLIKKMKEELSAKDPLNIGI